MELVLNTSKNGALNVLILSITPRSIVKLDSAQDQVGKQFIGSNYEPDNTQNQGSDGSSKLQELARLEEYLSLKLPPVVRRELKKVIDEAFAPIEGALANQFETIVRGCQESASRAFFDNLQPTSYLFTLSTAAKSQNYECANMTGGVHMGCPPDGLAPYDMPADSALEGSPQLGYAIPGVSSK